MVKFAQFISLVGLSGLALVAVPGTQTGSERLVGAWESHVQFRDGAFASVKDLELSYVFNSGGTMTESSNYDESQPVPPAYGIWRQTGPSRFEAKSIYYNTKPPAAFDDLAKGGGWAPAGKGELMETITLSKDRQSYSSVMTLQLYGPDGKPQGALWHATGHGKKMRF